MSHVAVDDVETLTLDEHAVLEIGGPQFRVLVLRQLHENTTPDWLLLPDGREILGDPKQVGRVRDVADLAAIDVDFCTAIAPNRNTPARREPWSVL